MLGCRSEFLRYGMSLDHGYCCLVRYDVCWVCAIFTDMLELAGDSIVYLTEERLEWLAAKRVSCT